MHFAPSLPIAALVAAFAAPFILLPATSASERSCAGAEAAFEKATQANTRAAMIDYINEHAPSLEAEAFDRLNTLPATDEDSGGDDAFEATDIEAGPIWSNEFAANTCPGVCEGGGLDRTGNWATTVPGEVSVCSCE